MRMLQILRGLCVAVDAEGMPLLQIFSSHAREALQEGSRPAGRAVVGALLVFLKINMTRDLR